MGITWNKKKVKFTPATGTEPEKYELEVFQGDTVDLLDYVVFEDRDHNPTPLDTWKRTLVNAAHYTDNGPASPTDYPGGYDDDFLDDTEIRQYASKYSLSISHPTKFSLFFSAAILLEPLPK